MCVDEVWMMVWCDVALSCDYHHLMDGNACVCLCVCVFSFGASWGYVNMFEDRLAGWSAVEYRIIIHRTQN